MSSFGNILTQSAGSVSIVSPDQVPVATLDFSNPGPMVAMMANFLRSGCKTVQLISPFASDWRTTEQDLPVLQGMFDLLKSGNEKFEIKHQISAKQDFVLFTIQRM